ncbi:LysR family transcriptional regulator [Carnobacterium maltaromaticum]|uniref:LysR family transcriptional regulator n=1 Tax=Carnobacterium TaxID=2747 RepID=UPI00298B1EA3|nr:LysR family transcriptional regulator [Carnobacterium maltaromaticum]MDW5523277.1 LysR family transcriptional regulator [Carnobacterium maltaromaticum]
MKLSNLKSFVDVATEGSFTKASEKSYISQPTLSRRIQELETELGVELFIRLSHGLALSNAGEQFLPEASKVLKSIDQLEHMFDHDVSSEHRSQIIRIGYLPNFNMGKMYELLARFRIDHPTIQFLMKPDTPMNLTEGVTNGRYDLVFNLAIYFQANPTIEKMEFMKNDLQIALPIDHKLSHQKKLNFADLSQETFILFERQQSPVIVDFVISQGIKNGFNLKVNSYVKDLNEGLSLVSVGKGLAFLYSGMNDGTLEEKYHINISDLETTRNNQNIVAAIDKHNDNELLWELFTFLKA